MSLLHARPRTVWQGVAGVALSAALSLSLIGLARAEVSIAENLSIEGFIDMSLFVGEDDDGETTINSALDQMELDFNLDFGEVTARIDIDSQSDVGETEQAYVSYAPEDMSDIGLTITVGRFLWLYEHHLGGGDPIGS